MSVVDALLLDPVRIDVWLVKRTDGIAGTGTQQDPLDGSTIAKFDTLMSGMAASTCVHLGPGEFQTAGYYDNPSTGWQPKTGMRIVGSGIDVTTLKLVNATATNQRVYAIAHALPTSTVDSGEVHELMIDSGSVTTQTTTWTAGTARPRNPLTTPGGGVLRC